MNYVYDVDPDATTAAAFVLRLVGKDKNVLEIGAGPGSITKPLIDVGSNKLTALEYDSDYVQNLKTFCPRVIQGDLNQHDWAERHFPGETFDAIVIADVLEHLNDPDATLKTASTLIDKEGYIVISLPHIAHNSIIASLMNGEFEYRDWGLLDRTHIRFFAIDTMQRLIDDAGLKIADARFVLTRPRKSEFGQHWDALPRLVRMALKTNKFGHVYQVVMKVVLKDSDAPGQKLRALPLNAGHTAKA